MSGVEDAHDQKLDAHPSLPKIFETIETGYCVGARFES